MAKKKENINNIIKSILLSDREITPKNIKYNVLHSLIKSDYKDELFNKRTNEMKRLIFHYSDQINNDSTLEHSSVYISELNALKEERIKKVMNGNYKSVVKSRLATMYKNELLEETWKDRGFRHFKYKYGTIPLKITDIEQFNYEYRTLQFDAIDNVMTTLQIIEQDELNNWYNITEEYCKLNYNNRPIILDSKIYLGENNFKKEEYLLYYNLSDGKIYIVYRLYLKY